MSGAARHIKNIFAMGTAAAATLAAAHGVGAVPFPVQAESTASSAPVAPLEPRNASLRLVQVVFRHGARTPLGKAAFLWEGQEWDVCGRAFDSVPLTLVDAAGQPEPPANQHDAQQVATRLAGGCSKGELTLIGQMQALELGWQLRRRYIDATGFLPASYTPGVLAARTTNFARTKATLAGVLTGLYPDTREPIPAVTSGDLDEILYADTKCCPHLKQLMSASEAMLHARWQSPQQAPEISRLQQQLEDVLNAPEGLDWSRRWLMTDLHDGFTSLAAHGKALPPGLTKQMRSEVERLATEEFAAFVCPALVDEHGHEVLRLSMGRLLDTLLSNMEAAAAPAAAAAAAAASSGTSTSNVLSTSLPRLMLYSGHDSTVMPLLTALGVKNQHWPPYISNLMFELWELDSQDQNPDTGCNTSRFAVRVLYNSEPMVLPGASEANPTLLGLSEFKHEVLAPFLLSQEQHAQACASRMTHSGAMPEPQGDGNSDDLDLSGGASSTSPPEAVTTTTPAQQRGKL